MAIERNVWKEERLQGSWVGEKSERGGCSARRVGVRVATASLWEEDRLQGSWVGDTYQKDVRAVTESLLN